MKTQNKELSLEFVTNMFGHASEDIKTRLQNVIDNPCQRTWDDAHCIILTQKGKMTTLWQAVIKIDWDMPRSKPYDAPWPHIPTSETIKEAIKKTVFSQIPLS
jgi:hypothetical protein